jgi:hypothetical protein
VRRSLERSVLRPQREEPRQSEGPAVDGYGLDVRVSSHELHAGVAEGTQEPLEPVGLGDDVAVQEHDDVAGRALGALVLELVVAEPRRADDVHGHAGGEDDIGRAGHLVDHRRIDRDGVVQEEHLDHAALRQTGDLVEQHPVHPPGASELGHARVVPLDDDRHERARTRLSVSDRLFEADLLHDRDLRSYRPGGRAGSWLRIHPTRVAFVAFLDRHGASEELIRYIQSSMDLLNSEIAEDKAYRARHCRQGAGSTRSPAGRGEFWANAGGAGEPTGVFVGC